MDNLPRQAEELERLAQHYDTTDLSEDIARSELQTRRTMTLYESSPSRIEAIQYGPEFRPGLVQEIAEFISGRKLLSEADILAYVQPEGPWDPPEYANIFILAGRFGAQGWVSVPLGHWIVRQPNDLTDHWPVDPEYFQTKYRKVEE